MMVSFCYVFKFYLHSILRFLDLKNMEVQPKINAKVNEEVAAPRSFVYMVKEQKILK